ncbi:hypothetical protein K8R42_00190 [bacterium]|nr:hypothetical protein [bacterium]
MAKIFQKGKKKRPFRPKNAKQAKARPKIVDPKDLVDPVLYLGGLDTEKYPFLPLENEEKQNQKPEEEVENPLNKR